MKALSGIRVLEIGQGVAAPYAAKLLADLGADVIKLEPPTGDRSRAHGPFPPNAAGDQEQSGLFLATNTNKRSVVADLETEAGCARLRALAAKADIVIHDLSAGSARDAGLHDLLDERPDMVVLAITPYGHTGPHAEWRGHEINIVHGGGWGWLIPGDDSDPAAPPLTVFGHSANYQAGMAGAMAALAAYIKADATGVGEFIDHSAMAYVSSILEAAFIAWSYRQEITGRSGGRILNPWNIYPCSDGLIFMVTVEQDQWERLVDLMGNPEWAQLEVFTTFEARAANRDLLTIYIQEWTSQHTVDYLFHEGQSRRICFAPVFTMADLGAQDHLHERGFFAHATHPVAGDLQHMAAPYRMTPDPWRLDRAAPLLGEHDDARFDGPVRDRQTTRTAAAGDRPLQGVRVVDFSWVWAGPFCTLQLAHLGAEVIKIESSSRPGLGRRLPIHPRDVPETLNTCGYFNQWDQGKKSVELDLTDPAAIESVLRLVQTADVVVDNYATGVMERLGLSDDVLRTANPDLIIASVTGYGHTGPLREYMGYGPTTAPLSGLTSMTGHIGGRPEEAGISFGDPAAGLTAAFAITAALLTRGRGDEPARIDVSLWESTAVNAAEAWMGHQLGAPAIQPAGSRHPVHAPHGIFHCSGEDRWVSIACTSDDQWQTLAGLIDDDLDSVAARDSRFATASDRKLAERDLEAVVSAWTTTREPWEITELLQSVGVAAYPSLNCEELEANVQHRAREFWERFDHPEVGQRTHSGVPWRTQNWPNGAVGRAALLGEHTAEILAELGPG